VIAEAEGKSPTALSGKGPVYAEKKQAYVQSERELKDLNATLLPLIQSNTRRVEQLLKTKDKRVESKRASIVSNNGFLTRIHAINQLADSNFGIKLISWFIVLLFVCIESAPMIVKLLAPRGPYDEFLDAENLEKTLMARRLIQDLEMLQDKNYNINFEKNKLEYLKAIETNAEFIDKVVRARNEINERMVEKWKQHELDEIEKNFMKYIPLIENTLKGHSDVAPKTDPVTIPHNDGSSKQTLA
jgi:hypothetical protein